MHWGRRHAVHDGDVVLLTAEGVRQAITRLNTCWMYCATVSTLASDEAWPVSSRI